MFKKLDKKHLINYLTMVESKEIAKSNIKEMTKSELSNITTKQQMIDFIHDNDAVTKRELRKLNKNELTERLTKSQLQKILKPVYQNPKTLKKQTRNQLSKNIPNKNITHLPLIEASLYDYHHSEIKLSDSPKRAEMSFIKLFKNRIKHLPKETVSISIKFKLNGDKEKKQTPYTVSKPINLTKEDNYKFAMYILIKKGFEQQSGDCISHIGANIKLDKKNIMDHKVGCLKLESYLLSKQRPRHGEESCVLDFIWDQVRGKPGFKTYDYKKLKNELYKYVDSDENISTRELIDWVKECHTNVSIHAFDCRYKNFVRHIAKSYNVDVLLVYIVKDHHLHPITNEKLKLIAAKYGQGGCDNLLKHLSEMKWTRRHDNIIKIDNKDDSFKERENNIIILPEDMKMNEAINLYSEKEGFYVEFMHWNNNGILDGFIDHKQNMYLLNDNYDDRKGLCDTLFNKYRTEDFRWVNQTYTSISSSVFKQICGYLPESSYNVKTREILDQYYPTALQWCTTDNIPDDIVNIDISKCYPSILLNSNIPIPIYSIHDVIEPFNGCVTELRSTGEFYIDETILLNYKTPIKIEAGFYSNILVSYLLEDLHMDKKQIKYKITTKKALKPDTFKEFIKYMFDTLPEKQAKIICNSLIGNLGKKYDIVNEGFVCTEYETAMNLWVQAMSENKNITIDHYNNTYLIKEKKLIAFSLITLALTDL